MAGGAFEEFGIEGLGFRLRYGFGCMGGKRRCGGSIVRAGMSEGAYWSLLDEGWD